MKLKKRKIIAIALVIGFVSTFTNPFTTHLSAENNMVATLENSVTFENQFADANTAKAVAKFLRKAVTDVMDANDLSITLLDLRGEHLTDFSGIEIFSNLETLLADKNNLTLVPESIKQLPNLKHLNLSSNKITSIPDSILQLEHLEHLDLSQNKITTIPENIGQLSNLDLLSLWGNEIKVIPDSIGQLSNLRILFISFNQIANIPESIGQLSNLEQVNLASNKISNLPDSIVQLSKLNKLVLFSNQITHLPSNIGQLSSLEHLLLFDNKLTVLPESFTQLLNLVDFNVSFNHLIDLPEVIYNHTHTTSTDFYFENQTSQAQLPLGTTNADYTFNILPIFGQSRTYQDGSAFVYKLIQPNGTEIIVAPTFENGKASIDKAFLTSNGNYTLQVEMPNGKLISSMYTLTFSLENSNVLFVKEKPSTQIKPLANHKDAGPSTGDTNNIELLSFFLFASAGVLLLLKKRMLNL